MVLMNKPLSPLPLRERAYGLGREAGKHLHRHWLKAALLGVAAYMAYEKDMDINLQLSNAPVAVIRSAAQPAATQAVAATVSYRPEARPMNTSHLNANPAPKQRPATAAVKERDKEPRNVSNLANTYSNLTAGDKGTATSESPKTVQSKRQKQKHYIKRFAKVAQMEMEKYGIPASITLAQGLLESNVGESKLASHNNNHFGIKCFSRSCRPGHCSNFTDDSHKDFFRKYKSAWESYRAHSLLLKRSDRYQPLFKLSSTDYRGWAKGLKKAGYATDDAYAEKLINLIEALRLQQYDR